VAVRLLLRAGRSGGGVPVVALRLGEGGRGHEAGGEQCGGNGECEWPDAPRRRPSVGGVRAHGVPPVDAMEVSAAALSARRLPRPNPPPCATSLAKPRGKSCPYLACSMRESAQSPFGNRSIAIFNECRGPETAYSRGLVRGVAVIDTSLPLRELQEL